MLNRADDDGGDDDGDDDDDDDDDDEGGFGSMMPYSLSLRMMLDVTTHQLCTVVLVPGGIFLQTQPQIAAAFHGAG